MVEYKGTHPDTTYSMSLLGLGCLIIINGLLANSFVTLIVCIFSPFSTVYSIYGCAM